MNNTSKTSRAGYIEKQQNGGRSNEATNNLPAQTDELTIIVLLLPQLLKWIGFILLPFPFFCRYGIVIGVRNIYDSSKALSAKTPNSS